MSNWTIKENIRHWCSVIDRHYAEGQHTVGPCRTEGCMESARGSYYCAECAVQRLQAYIGAIYASEYRDSAVLRNNLVRKMNLEVEKHE